MKQEKVLENIRSLYLNNRELLIEKLKTFDWENSMLSNINEKINKEIDRPILTLGGLDEQIRLSGFRDAFGDIQTGDISDKYTIVINPETNKITDWDFTDFIKNDKEIRFLRVWVNWFLPIYYLETNYEKGQNKGKSVEFGPLDKLTPYEDSIKEKVDNTLQLFNYTKCDLEFLKQEIKGVKTDLIDTSPSLFECAFSDLTNFWEEVQNSSSYFTE